MEDTARHFQIVEILNSNDLPTIQARLTPLLASSASSPTSTFKPPYGSPLHIAVSLCSPTICEWIVQTFCSPNSSPTPKFFEWVNTPNSPDGETPLHIASKLGRIDILEALLKLPQLDDTARTAHGKFPEDLAKTDKVRERIRAHKEEYTQRLRVLVLNAIDTTHNLTEHVTEVFASNPRAKAYLQVGWFDINAPLETAHEYTLLHIASKRDDLALVEWCLANGGDPSVKDRKGNKPADLAVKKGDAKVKARLKVAINQTPILALQNSQTKLDDVVLAMASNSLNSSGGSNFTGSSSTGGHVHELSTASNSSGAALTHDKPTIVTSAPSLKGVLQKWTNYASGYKNRYFVLEDGIFSYFKSEKDYPHYCRGSIRTDHTDVHPDLNDKARFEVVGKGVKYGLRARSTVEAKKWMWAIVESRQWVIDRNKSLSQNSEVPDTPEFDADSENDEEEHVRDHSFQSSSTSRAHSTEPSMSLAMPPKIASSDAASSNAPPSPTSGVSPTSLDTNKSERRNSFVANIAGALSSAITGRPSRSSFSSPKPHTTSTASSPSAPAPTTTNATTSSLRPPQPPTAHSGIEKLSEEASSLIYLLNIQLDLQSKCVDTVVEALRKVKTSSSSSTAGKGTTTAASPMSGDLTDMHRHVSPSASSPNDSDSIAVAGITSPFSGMDLNNVPTLLKTSHNQVNEYVSKLIKITEKRDEYWNRKFIRNEEKRKRWEDVVRKVLDAEVEMGRARSGSVTGGNPMSNSGSGSIGNAGTTTTFPNTSPGSASATSPSNRNGGLTSAGMIASETSDIDEDEFFDADNGEGFSNGGIEEMLGFQEYDEDVEHATKKSMQSLVASKQSVMPVSKVSVPVFDNLAGVKFALKGYINSQGIFQVRSSLPLDPKASKPALSLWSFLKSAIGKDLSKVALPVFFNEPLTMLQRLCEDVEYSELLSLAGRIGNPVYNEQQDPVLLAAKSLNVPLQEVLKLQGDDASLLRLMLVAGFAMSNYSSTVNRIGKPFNPMLGETFECVRADKNFRYIAEQVCHHPPISACYCDSPDYTFSAEVNVKSKFWGKSLEVHPLGNNHVQLPVYETLPDGATKIAGSDHFSWKKVITSVNGLIVGKLWIIHYGDMVIKNWRTGEEATVTFKQKESGGWFGLGGSKSGDSDEQPSERDIVGTVKDKSGRVRFEFRGRWDEKLVAYPVNPSPSSPTFLTKPITIWQRQPPPSLSAQNFHFTNFAVSLNELPDSLNRYLPPTDSRLRPDPRAMEKGEWSLADESKNKVETCQRERRKKIVKDFETHGTKSGPPHLHNQGIEIGEAWWTPRWFVREIDPDTKEEHWRFTTEYWKHREELVRLRESGDEKTRGWPEWVLDVFNPVDQQR